ncbi:MAG: hypothetical protein KAR42_12180 [candidate division Zixibacteria bacterium]|nr:hypothetical protein [candidate division Zixibacteria bacterium]
MTDVRNSSTFSLFAKPSFIEGVARVFDFGATLQVYNYSNRPDRKALRNDWEAVGDALRESIKKYGKEKR